VPQPGPSDYRAPSHRGGAEPLNHGNGEYAGGVKTIAEELGTAIKERPYTTLFIAGGLAFALGALWYQRRQQQYSSYDRLIERLPDRRQFDRALAHLPDSSTLEQWLALLPGRQSLERWWRS
jgi:hypothetical protein